MIDVLLIDKTGQAKSFLPMEKLGIEMFDNEVRALNVIEQALSPVVLLHYNVREKQTEDYIRLLRQVSLNSKIVVVADALDEGSILRCLLAGAKGYQEVGQLSRYAEKMIAVIDAGEAWITRRMTATLLDSLRR